MSIFDRLGRVARSEVTEMKRVLREARDEGRRGNADLDPFGDDLSYQADIAAADAELARDLGDPLSDVFARELGTPSPSTGWGATDPDMAQGASLWGPAPGATGEPGQGATGPGTRGRGATVPEPRVGDKPVAPGWIDVPTSGPPPDPWSKSGTGAPAAEATRPPPGRTETFPREMREAYAVLELPLGSGRSRIDQSFRALLHRYHPDLHAGNPELQRTASELTIKLREARDLLHAWLEGRL
jgi:hypothetical protein